MLQKLLALLELALLELALQYCDDQGDLASPGVRPLLDFCCPCVRPLLGFLDPGVRLLSGQGRAGLGLDDLGLRCFGLGLCRASLGVGLADPGVGLLLRRGSAGIGLADPDVGLLLRRGGAGIGLADPGVGLLLRRRGDVPCRWRAGCCCCCCCWRAGCRWRRACRLAPLCRLLRGSRRHLIGRDGVVHVAVVVVIRRS